MAHNTVLDPMTGGDTIATEEIAGIKHERLKFFLGEYGVDDGDVSFDNPMPVALARNIKRTTDSITSYPIVPTAVVLTASGQILNAPGQLVGYHVNSVSGGSFRISNALTATTPYQGAACVPPATGYQDFPANLTIGGYVTISGTIDITFFVIPN